MSESTVGGIGIVTVSSQRFQNRRRNAVAFAAENEAAIAGEIRLRQFIFRARMRGDAADAASAQLLQTFHQRQFHGVRLFGELMPLAELGQFDDRQLKNRAHRIPNSAAQIRTAACLADNQRLDAERDAIAHERADVFRVGQLVNGDEELRLRTFRQNVVERNGGGTLPTARTP